MMKGGFTADLWRPSEARKARTAMAAGNEAEVEKTEYYSK